MPKKQTLLKILKRNFYRDSFKEVLGGDDFFEAGIASVRDALEAAYEAGMQAGIKKAEKKQK